jgi:hypothetical protein
MSSSNPSTISINYQAHLPPPLISSVFITTGMGPVGQNNTMTTFIDKALNITKVLSDIAYEIEQDSGFLVDSVNTIM